MSKRMIHLEIRHEESEQKEERRFDAKDGPITIGRDPESTISLTTQAISRKHITIEPAPDGWVVVDHSTLGTTLNDTPLETEKPTLLGDGDRIALHDTIICATILGTRAEGEKEEEYADNLMRLVDDVKKEVEGTGRIEVLHAGRIAGSVPLGAEGSSLLIGRSNECEVQVDDPLRLVSGVHARLEREWAGAFLYDLSRNGVYVNGRKVEDCVPLAPGDRITLALPEERTDGVVLAYLETDESAEQVPSPKPERTADAKPAEPDRSTGEGSPQQTAPPAREEIPPETIEAPGDEAPTRKPDVRNDSGRRESGKTSLPSSGKKASAPGQGAFFWSVIAVIVVVVVIFAVIGMRIAGS